MSWVAATLGALGSVGSSLINGLFNSGSALSQYKYQTALNQQGYKYSKKLQELQNVFNYKVFQEENAFNQSMFNQSAQLASQAHQIEVEDLRKAGLNPILSATGGNGASVVSPVASAQTSSGSATMSGGSASAFNRELKLESLFRGLQYELDKKMNDSNIHLNESQDRLNVMAGDKAHEEAAYINEQNRQFQDYNPIIQQAIIDNYNSQTAKNLQDTVNSKKLTDSQILLNASSASSNYANAHSSPYKDLSEKVIQPVYHGFHNYFTSGRFINDIKHFPKLSY